MAITQGVAGSGRTQLEFRVRSGCVTGRAIGPFMKTIGRAPWATAGAAPGPVKDDSPPVMSGPRRFGDHACFGCKPTRLRIPRIEFGVEEYRTKSTPLSRPKRPVRYVVTLLLGRRRRMCTTDPHVRPAWLKPDPVVSPPPNFRPHVSGDAFRCVRQRSAAQALQRTGLVKPRRECRGQTAGPYGPARPCRRPWCENVYSPPRSAHSSPPAVH